MVAKGERELARLLRLHAGHRAPARLPRDRGGRLRRRRLGRAPARRRRRPVRRRRRADASRPASGTRSPTRATRTSSWSSASPTPTTRRRSAGDDLRDRAVGARAGRVGLPHPRAGGLLGSHARPRQRTARRRRDHLHQAQGPRARRGRRRTTSSRSTTRRRPSTWRPSSTRRSTRRGPTWARSSTPILPT